MSTVQVDNIKLSGIYKIESKVHPEKIYIGSAVSIKGRWAQHRGRLRNNKHHSLKLQRHCDKYGLDDLIFDILEEGDYVNITHLLSREQMWYGKFEYGDTDIPYFNNDKIAGSREGFKHSEESKRKMSLARKGKPGHSGFTFKVPEYELERRRWANMGPLNPQYGKKRSAESCLEQSIRQTGKKHRPDTIQKMSDSAKGRVIEWRVEVETRRYFNERDGV